MGCYISQDLLVPISVVQILSGSLRPVSFPVANSLTWARGGVNKAVTGIECFILNNEMFEIFIGLICSVSL